MDIIRVRPIVSNSREYLSLDVIWWEMTSIPHMMKDRLNKRKGISFTKDHEPTSRLVSINVLLIWQTPSRKPGKLSDNSYGCRLVSRGCEAIQCVQRKGPLSQSGQFAYSPLSPLWFAVLLVEPHIPHRRAILLRCPPAGQFQKGAFFQL